MATLTVKDFSCIDAATLEISRLTILIGPQASGKSVLSKLAFFFQNVIAGQSFGGEIELDIDAFKSRIAQDFVRWFPISAWGSKKFYLEFVSGPVTIVFDRKRSYKKPSEAFHIHFSHQFLDVFDRTSKLAEEMISSEKIESREPAYHRWELRWDIQRQSRTMIADMMGAEYVDYQMFVPAGRAFFTSVGKAISAFEQSGFLDPATLAFGRYWASVRDRNIIGYEDDFEGKNNRLMTEIFGGRLVRERDHEYVLSTDGRKVPVSALSSGQQELLPLWLSIERYFSDEHGSDDHSMMYIEEPEAHLFPHAQSKLVEFLTAKLYTPAKNRRRMLITTHSPYVLSKLNNLITASIAGRRASKEQASALSSMVPRASWLRPNHMAAYAIIDRKLVNIVNNDGLIDAAYLDQVSDDIMHEFSAIMEIAYA